MNEIQTTNARTELTGCPDTGEERDVQSASSARAALEGLLKMLDSAVALIGRWQARRRDRRMLREMDEHLLKDIGISRADAYREWRKPFWSA